ncbi:hypothetical protein L2E82_42268 [Cichorium intybus]|uniref:Uncharacterized protein n=1 Tax=Cichorium intybus TaxID=13427 RepID=A0ACB8ZMQ2_CICIN|nr:hypothetical protein L2E82_42268 [Cichorium intybus]
MEHLHACCCSPRICVAVLEELAAYNLQDDGCDTIEGNDELGFPVDSRMYVIGALELAVYNLQDGGRDTVEANDELGLPVNSRVYVIGA